MSSPPHPTSTTNAPSATSTQSATIPPPTTAATTEQETAAATAEAATTQPGTTHPATTQPATSLPSATARKFDPHYVLDKYCYTPAMLRRNNLENVQWADVEADKDGNIRSVFGVPISEYVSKEVRTICSRLFIRGVKNARKAAMLDTLSKTYQNLNGIGGVENHLNANNSSDGGNTSASNKTKRLQGDEGAQNVTNSQMQSEFAKGRTNEKPEAAQETTAPKPGAQKDVTASKAAKATVISKPQAAKEDLASKSDTTTRRIEINLENVNWNDLDFDKDGNVRMVLGMPLEEFRSRELRTLCSRLAISGARNAKRSDMISMIETTFQLRKARTQLGNHQDSKSCSDESSVSDKKRKRSDTSEISEASGEVTSSRMHSEVAKVKLLCMRRECQRKDEDSLFRTWERIQANIRLLRNDLTNDRLDPTARAELEADIDGLVKRKNHLAVLLGLK